MIKHYSLRMISVLTGTHPLPAQRPSTGFVNFNKSAAHSIMNQRRCLFMLSWCPGLITAICSWLAATKVLPTSYSELWMLQQEWWLL